MKKEVLAGNKKICYDLQYKKVKNINLRIKPDGTVCVSANKRVSQKIIDGFILSKADFILKAQEKYKDRQSMPRKQYFTENEICELIEGFCRKVYPYYEIRGVKYPQIKFRRMVSRWGSCHPVRGILTFNINLMYVPRECVEYVVWHEFTHFLQANHSKFFYEELSAVCPDWKLYRKMLKDIPLRQG